jgi:pilus assembly protein CpaC
MDVLASLNLMEASGRATILAEPTLTALSGETATFLAGGEFPIPIAQSLGSVSVEYKQYGVGLAFTPTVLADGRISMRVRPEVSELSDQGSVRMNNFVVPALTTRRAETTVELGSGQSFVIGGLLRNTGNNSVDKAPWLGDLPILGALFRSNSFRRQETELVIVVTPYLVRPVSDSQIALPTDGFRNADDLKRVLLDKSSESVSGEQRPGPIVLPSSTAAPSIGPAAALTKPAPTTKVARRSEAPAPAAKPSAAPGFAF